MMLILIRSFYPPGSKEGLFLGDAENLPIAAGKVPQRRVRLSNEPI